MADSAKTRKRTKNLIFEYQKHADENALPKPGLFIPTSSSTNSLPIPDQAPKIESSNHTTTEAPSTSITVSTTKVEQNNTPENDNMSITTDNVSELQKGLSSTPHNVAEHLKIDEANVEDDSGKNDITKNTDLFKAIFLSSSESEAEDEDEEKEKEQKRKKDEILSNVLSDQLVPKIKPIKEGILSNIDFKAFQSSKASKETVSPETTSQPDPNIFGPRLPTNKVAASIPPTAAGDRKEVNDDEWVEKSEKRKEKKHKSHKHKKKHKHKHKK